VIPNLLMKPSDLVFQGVQKWSKPSDSPACKERKQPTKKPTIGFQGVASSPRRFRGSKITPRLTCIFATIWDLVGLPETTPRRATDQKVPALWSPAPLVRSLYLIGKWKMSRRSKTASEVGRILASATAA
jgi:hypothetical protein